jgi:hypothetical protein
MAAGDPAGAYRSAVEKMNSKLKNEKEAIVEQYMRGTPGTVVQNGTNDKREWGHDDLQLLIKAVNLFPAGTVQRSVRRLPSTSRFPFFFPFYIGLCIEDG